jgi:hypothetical protein
MKNYAAWSKAGFTVFEMLCNVKRKFRQMENFSFLFGENMASKCNCPNEIEAVIN